MLTIHAVLIFSEARVLVAKFSRLGLSGLRTYRPWARGLLGSRDYPGFRLGGDTRIMYIHNIIQLPGSVVSCVQAQLLRQRFLNVLERILPSLQLFARACTP